MIKSVKIGTPRATNFLTSIFKSPTLMSMDEKPVPSGPVTPAGDGPEQPFSSGSLLDKLKSKIPDSTHFTKTILIPAAVVVGVLFVGVGGTYVIASNIFKSSTDIPSSSRISENDLPSTDSAISDSPSIASSSGKTTSKSKPAPSVNPTPTIPAGWTSYNFSVLNLNFSYPPGWFVNVPSSSGAPYLYVQNFSGNLPLGYSPGQFAILISRLEQVGITTVTALTTQLAINAASSVFINGQNMGQVNVISATPIMINGYQALQRTVTYSSSPSAQMTETYILDGVSNVVEFIPLLDTSYGQTYYNQLLNTVSFTN